MAGLVVLGDDGGEPENGRHGGAGLLEPDRRFGESQVHRLVDEGHLLAVVMSRRPTTSAVGGTGVVVGLVDRLPAADQVAERLGHELDVASPCVCAIRFHEESAGFEEPAGKGEMVQRDPGHNAGVSRRREHVAVVAHRRLVVVALLRLDARPLNRQPVMGQAQ